ncbi:MAG: NlpC/P60 family protein [Bacillus sp. (in: firmicutes)]
MIKKVAVVSAAIIVGLGTICIFPTQKTKAEEITPIQEQRSNVQTEISKNNVELLQVQNELEKITEQINRVEQAIKDNSNMITETEEKVKSTQLEVEMLQQEVTLVKERVAKRNEVLKKRALALQVSGRNVSYFDVLLGSSSFRDFVDRLGAVATIVEADQDLIQQHKDDQADLEKKQELVEKKLGDLKNLKIELEGMQSQILEQKQQNDALKEELKQREQEKLLEKAELLQKDTALTVEVNSPLEAHTYSLNLAIPTTSNEAINMVIHAGEKYIGNSVYVFGGGRNEYDISQGRFDCSAFVAWAFAQAGIKVGAHTDLLKNTGTRVAVSEARPGDLVFFDTYKIDGHVGIYLGGGKFIGSQSSTGIAIADMTQGYYQKKFNGRVMRIIND